MKQHVQGEQDVEQNTATNQCAATGAHHYLKIKKEVTVKSRFIVTLLSKGWLARTELLAD